MSSLFAGRTEKLTNPAFAYEGEGFRRSSSSSSLNSIFSPDGDLHIRTCSDCRDLLERRDEQISRRSSRPALVVLYDVSVVRVLHILAATFLNTVNTSCLFPC